MADAFGVLLGGEDRQSEDLAAPDQQPGSLNDGRVFADQGKEAKAEVKPAATVAPAAKPKESKLSYKQQQELEKIPKDIEKLEAQMAVIESAIAADGFYSQEQKLIDAKLAELTTLQAKLDVLYARWEELLAI